MNNKISFWAHLQTRRKENKLLIRTKVLGEVTPHEKMSSRNSLKFRLPFLILFSLFPSSSFPDRQHILQSAEERLSLSDMLLSLRQFLWLCSGFSSLSNKIERILSMILCQLITHTHTSCRFVLDRETNS